MTDSNTTFGDASGFELPPETVIFGHSPQMLEVQKRIERLAKTDIPVLISGSSGTGKEVISRLLHMRSPWRDGPFVKINCPAIPESLMESELFGYERGAFTGAFARKMGRVELANRGTLFMDEIGELKLSLQSKLLQLLQDRSFCRIGASEDKKVEVRIVCATNRDLKAEVEAGSFRQDLYYRINVLSIQLPPLTERRADISMLIDYFITSFSKSYGRAVRPFSGSMMKMFESYYWPGNIREMENLIKRYIIFGSEEMIAAAIQPRTTASISVPLGDEPISLNTLTRQAMKQFERKIIMQVLSDNRWSRKKTANKLSMSYRSLLYKLRDAGISSRENGAECTDKSSLNKTNSQD
jgi:two-component system response regulator AtoC